MPDFGPAITCLTGTYAAFITQEAAKLIAKISSIIASFTDPLENLADTNVKQIVNDVSDLASGNIAGSLASMGAAILVNKVKRELNTILADVIKQNPGIGDAIQRITNIAEAVYGILSLAVMLRRESPYSAVKLIIEDLEELLEQKSKNLDQLKAHALQLNNVIQVATNNPTSLSQLLADDLAEAVDFLDAAADDLTAMQVAMAASTPQFSKKDFDSAQQNLESAEALICPSSDTNVLDVVSLFAQASVGNEFLTDAQLKLATYSITPLALLMQCELDAIDKGTKRINNYIEQLPAIIPDYQAAAESDFMKEFRLKLIRQLRIRTTQLAEDVEAGISTSDLSSIGLQALSWSARIETLLDMLPRVQNQLTVGSSDDTRLQNMRAELELMLNALDDINSQNVTCALEDTTGLKAQITTMVGQAKNIMSLMGSNKITSYDLDSFQATVTTTVNSGFSSIKESKDAIEKIEKALDIFKTNPATDQKLEQLLGLLELLGMDRAKDLLRLGKFTDFLNTTIDDASYIGLAIKCLINVEGLLTDNATLAIVREIREALESQRISELAAAFDILDSGKNAAILEVKNYLQEGQDNLQRVARVITELKRLATKAGQTVSALTEAAEGLGQELGELSWSPSGSFNQDMTDLDIDGLQAGCLGQLKF